MIDYYITTLIAFFSILSLAKIISYKKKTYNYFLSIITITLLSIILLILNLGNLIYIFKISLIIILLFLFIMKKVKIDNLDFFAFFIIIFLLYYNYNDLFVKSDTIEAYGLLIKDIFINSELPHYNNSVYFNNYSFPYGAAAFQYYFISGAKEFNESIVILSHNFFLIMAFAGIFKNNDFKINQNSISKLFIFILLFYLLINIFGQGGKNIFIEEFSIIIIFFTIIFINENKIQIFSINNIILYILTLSFAFGKQACYFLLIFPILLYLFQTKDYFKKKILNVLALMSLFMIATTYISVSNQINQDEYYNKIVGPLNFLNTTIEEKNKHFEKIIKSDKDMIYKSIYKDQHYSVRYIFRLKYLFENKNEYLSKTLNNNYKNIIVTSLNVEIYKASLLPIVRYIYRIQEEKELKKYSVTLPLWIIIILLLFFVFYKKKIKSTKFILFLSLILILTNFLLVIENEIRKTETIYYDDKNNTEYIVNEYDPHKKVAGDISRYLGWSIFIVLLVQINILSKHYYFRSKKITIYLLSFLIIISPARSYGYLIKINNQNIVAQKNYQMFDDIANKNLLKQCNQLIAITSTIDRSKFMLMKYIFYEKKIIVLDQVIDEINNPNLIDYLNLTKQKKGNCLITNKISNISNELTKMKYKHLTDDFFILFIL
jgi:hypothetical protein